MTCDELRPELVDFADGQLPDERAAAVEAHLTQCAACREQVQRLRRSLALAKQVWDDGECGASGGVGVSPALSRRLLPRVAAALALAAGVVIAVGVWHAVGTGPTTTPGSIASNHGGGSQPGSGGPHDAAPGETPGSDRVAQAPSEAPLTTDAEAALRREIERAGIGAQLLYTADLLAETPGGRDIACMQYEHIRSDYAELAAAADERLKKFCCGE